MPQGTLWHGRGVVATANARIPIAWDLDLWPLLRGVVQIRVRSDVGADSPRGTVDLRAGAVTLRDTDVTVPATAVAAVLGDMPTGFVEGDVNASTSNLNLATGSNRGEARLVWRNARIGGAVPFDLGEVRTTLVADGATMSGPLTNEGGSVALRGEWALRENEALTLALRVTPRRPDQVELARWLAAVGTPDGDGWRVNWRLPLR